MIRAHSSARPAALSVGLAFAAAHAGWAQAPSATAGAAMLFETYTFGSPAAAGAKSISLLAAPFAVHVVPTRGLTLDAGGAVARGVVALQDGSSATLAGLTDTELRATLALEREGGSVALAAIGLLPSGHATLASGEIAVASVVASDLLPFRVSNWGSGGGGAVDITGTRALAGGSAGVSASYRIAGTFQPLEQVEARYRPGAELRLRFALDRTLASDQTVAFQLSYSRFGEDRWDGTGLLQTGQRVLALGTYALPAGNSVVTTYGGVLYRSGGALGDAVLWSGVLSGVKPPSSETLLLLGSATRIPWRQGLLQPGLDFRLLRRGDGTGQGMLVGLGGSAELPVGSAGTRIVPSARVRLGQLLVAEGADSGILGFELGLGLGFGGAR